MACTIGSISNLVLRREEITHLKFQPRLRCEIDGEKICDYVADFSYFDRQEIGRHGQHGCEVVIEVKGYKTDVYKFEDKG